ncbi:MAG: hypothetical protein OXE98_08675 [Hyphomicrobiales bacterium]|nr:hypothetical protein [Hyphomicrobiales bacterium]
MNEQDSDGRPEKPEHPRELPETQTKADAGVLQAERKESKAEGESAIERLRPDYERFRTDIERRFNKLLIVLIGVGIGVAVMGLLYRGIGS